MEISFKFDIFHFVSICEVFRVAPTLFDGDQLWHIKHYTYRNDPKFSDRYAWANSADPDQTAPRGAVWSGSTLFAIPAASFWLITLW